MIAVFSFGRRRPVTLLSCIQKNWGVQKHYFSKKRSNKKSAEIDHTLQKLIFHAQKGDQSLPDIIFVIIIATIMNTTNKINQLLHTGRWCSTGLVRRRAWWPPGELPTTSLLCTTLTIRWYSSWWSWLGVMMATGGPAVHLAVVYATWSGEIIGQWLDYLMIENDDSKGCDTSLAI